MFKFLVESKRAAYFTPQDAVLSSSHGTGQVLTSPNVCPQPIPTSSINHEKENPDSPASRSPSGMRSKIRA
jgi:hypothetical protein